LHDLAQAASYAVARVAQVEALPVLFHVLQQQRAVAKDLGVRSLAQLLVVTGLAPCRVKDKFV